MVSLARRVRRTRGTVPQPMCVGPYRLCLELASGGMASVYLARDESNVGAARFVAVKRIHPHLAGDSTFAEMFVDEAEIASRIRHPNVCRVYDFDVAGGTSYIAMEYLVGEPIGAIWRKLSRRDGADPKRVARLVARMMADACEGLHAAHELTDDDGEPLSVVHRDVSPGNIILTFEGVTKVVDFGVAAAAGKRHQTQTGMLKGKLAYIAPECLRGQKADRRSDVWAVGVVAWELLTGERLFRRSGDVETLQAVMGEPIRAPSELHPGLPRELDDIVMLALERDPRDRYETARDLARDLARFATREDMVTVSDLGAWLDELFPGTRERKEQLLEMAAQIGRRGAEAVRTETTAPTVTTVGASASSPPSGAGTDDDTPAAGQRDRKPLAFGAWAVTVALGLGALGGGTATWAVDQAQGPPASAPALTIEAPKEVPAAQAPAVQAPAVQAPTAPPAPPAVPETPAEHATPEVRIRSGGSIARGPYVLELVDSGPDELVLRVRLDGAPSALSRGAPSPRRAPTTDEDPRPRWRRRPPDPAPEDGARLPAPRPSAHRTQPSAPEPAPA